MWALGSLLRARLGGRVSQSATSLARKVFQSQTSLALRHYSLHFQGSTERPLLTSLCPTRPGVCTGRTPRMLNKSQGRNWVQQTLPRDKALSLKEGQEDQGRLQEDEGTWSQGWEKIGLVKGSYKDFHGLTKCHDKGRKSWEDPNQVQSWKKQWVDQ